MEDTLLHGDLDLSVVEAQGLPNMDLCAERLRRCLATCGLPFPVSSETSTSRTSKSDDTPRRSHHKKAITSDPYVTVSIAGATVARTVIVPNDQNPRWSQRFLIPLAHSASHIYFHVKDNDFLGAQLIGTVSIPTSLLAAGHSVQGWFTIISRSGGPPKPNSALFLKMQFFPVGAIPKKLGVDRAYFPERTSGEVTLYQDAQVRDGELLPEIELEGGRVFGHDKCWEDICHAVLDAHKLIYIVGWSVYDKVRLVREPTRPLPKDGDLSLGELLKYKSQEGVRVLMLVWDDKTSHDHLLLRTV